MAGRRASGAVAVAEINPYEAPRADNSSVGRLIPGGWVDLGAGLWQDGEILVARSGAKFPDRCITCNAPAEGYRFKRTVRWLPPAYNLMFIFIFIFCAVIFIYAIVAIFLAKTVRVEAGLCPTHRVRRRNAILVGWLMSTLGLVVLIGGSAGASITPVGATGSGGGLVVDRWHGGLMIVGSLLIPVGIVSGVVRSQVLVPKRIEKGIIWLRRIDRDFLAPLPTWYA